MAKYYTGVGSRESPEFVCEAMTEIAIVLEKLHYTLRSGGAGGADLAFERGAKQRKHIYLPWAGFNGSQSPLYGVCQSAIDMALTIHPAPDLLRKREKALLLHSRNCYQVLGKTLDIPSEFLVCWTENAQLVGGTRTAIVLAERNKIPVLNLGKCKDYNSCIDAFEIFHMMYG